MLITEAQMEAARRGTLDSLVSEENPVPWREWLPRRTVRKGIRNGVEHWVSANCHYVVKDGVVYGAFGFSGFTLFRELSKRSENTRLELLKRLNTKYGGAWYFLADMAEKGLSDEQLRRAALAVTRVQYAEWVLRNAGVEYHAQGILNGAITCVPQAFAGRAGRLYR